jgi:hypothetical protein
MMFEKVEALDHLHVYIKPRSGFPVNFTPIAMLTVECTTRLGSVTTGRAKALTSQRDDCKHPIYQRP